MPRLGEAWVNIRANLKPLQAGLRKAFKSVSDMLRRITRTIIRAGKWAVIGFIAISTAAAKMAMDAEESENLFEVAMGKMAQTTRKWSDQISKTLGLNAYEVRKYVSTFNVMLESMGIAPKKTTEMSKKLVELAYDMASFFNLRPAEAFQKLQAGISGEAEPLKRLGILVNETTIKQWALNQGLIEGKEQLSEVQKVMARYGVILDRTQKAQGDLERTAGSATNILRSLKSQIVKTAIAYGTQLLPVVTKTAKRMRDWLAENEEMFKRWGITVAKQIQKTIDYITMIYDLIRSGRIELAFEIMTRRIIETMRNMWETLKADVFPVATKIGEAMGKGIKQGIEKEFPGIAKMYKVAEWIPPWLLIRGAAKGLTAFKPPSDVASGAPQILFNRPKPDGEF